MFQDELQTKSQNFILTFVACIYLWTALEQDIIVFNIPESLPLSLGAEKSNCIIENLPFDCRFSAMKEVVDGVLYYATQIT